LKEACVGGIILKVLFFQILAANVVISVLKKILNYKLEELAVKKLEYIKLDAQDAKVDSLTLVAPGKISIAIQNKIDHICKKKFGHPVKFNIKTDKSLKGGLIIAFKETIIDYSLIGRLKEAGIIAPK
jgi:F0F1-type ATP synthase delta subunit